MYVSKVQEYYFVRDVFKEYVYNLLKTKKLRGIVEIDESLFGIKIKHNRHQNVCNNRNWILGTFMMHFVIVNFVNPTALNLPTNYIGYILYFFGISYAVELILLNSLREYIVISLFICKVSLL